MNIEFEYLELLDSDGQYISEYIWEVRKLCSLRVGFGTFAGFLTMNKYFDPGHFSDLAGDRSTGALLR